MPALSRLLAAAVVLVGIGLVVGWSWSEVGAPPRASEHAGPAGAGAATATASGEEREPAAALAGATEPAAGSFVVIGRCVQAPGVVLPEVDVALFAGGGRSREPLAITRSGADGRFSQFVAPTGQALRVELTAPGRASVLVEQDDVAPGGRWDLGDVWLPAIGRLRGEVVESSGAPVPRAIVRLLHPASTNTNWSWSGAREAVCDDAGRFQFAEPLAVGEWYPMLVGTGGLIAPRRVQVEPGDVGCFVRIEVEPIDPSRSIVGRVVDGDGVPVAGLDVTAYGDGRRGEARTGQDGAFVLPCAGPSFDRGQSGVELDVRSDAHELVSPGGKVRVQWGRHDVVLVVQPFGRTRVRLAMPNDQPPPVGRWRVHRVLPEGAMLDLVRGAAQAEPGPVLQLQLLRRGEHVVWFVPDEPKLPIAGPLRFFANGPLTAAEHELPWPLVGALDVVVQDGTGRAFPGSTIELVQAVGKPAEPAKVALPLRPHGQRVGRALQVQVAAAATDEHGHARVELAVGEYLLRVSGRRHRPAHRLVRAGPSGEQVVVVAEVASVVHGTLTPQGLIDAAWASIENGGQPPVVLAFDESGVELGRTPLARGGTFELVSLPPGPVALRAWLWASCSGSEPQRVDYGLGTVVVPPASDWRGSFDLGAQQNGSVTGTVWLDGQPVASAQLFAWRMAPEPTWMARLHGDAAGRFAAALPAGEYTFHLAVPHQPGPGHVIVPWPERHRLAAGGALDLRLEQTTRRLLVRVLREQQPVVGARLRFDVLGYQSPTSLQTDATGRCVVQMPPPAPFVWTLTTADGVVHPLSVPDAAALRGEHEFVVELGQAQPAEPERR
ncbi:MAG: carboxypeptidase-like regulatory domain-containing protein [Planctomycetota bacterium]